jgi:hypothetical protein
MERSKVGAGKHNKKKHDRRTEVRNGLTVYGTEEAKPNRPSEAVVRRPGRLIAFVVFRRPGRRSVPVVPEST